MNGRGFVLFFFKKKKEITWKALQSERIQVVHIQLRNRKRGRGVVGVGGGGGAQRRKG